MNKSSNIFKVSVRKFVNFACRTGDLDHSGPAGPSALEGQNAHKKIQSTRSSTEQAEVKVSTTICTRKDNVFTDDDHECQLILSGRVDLLDDNPDAPRIGEIKSCYAPPEKIPQGIVDLHWAQLKVYGYCWLHQLQEHTATQQPPDISLRLIWINVVTNEITIDEKLHTYDSLREFSINAATRYLLWMRIINAHRKEVVRSAKTLTFPHTSFRIGQREMAAAVYISARDKGSLLCEAPTGTGKTISTLFPALKAIGESHIDSVVYLTAKNSGRVAANDSILNLQNAGLTVSAITITSKKTSCHCSNGTCERNRDGRCPLTIGFFDRLPQAREKLISQGVISPVAIDAAAHQYQLCPFELTQQMLPWVTVVICDYNYVFDPLVRFSHFSENAGRMLLLIDEAHNLLDRARSMYSARLDKQQLKVASDETNHNDYLCSELKRVIRALDRWAGKSDEPEHSDPGKPATVSKAVTKCTEALAATLENNLVLSEAQSEVAKELYRYMVIEDLFGDQHCTITRHKRHRKTRQVNLKLQCLNATAYLHHSFKQFRATVAFSATLRPLHFFRESLGLPDTTACLALPSPFNPAQQGSFLCSWVDTRYQARERAVAPIVDITWQVYQARRGNYQIFFPSYVFMEKVFAAFTEKYPSIPVIIQERGSSEQERQRFLNTFDQDDATLAFAIMGGVFGEGVDYTGNKLIGSIIVGTGLASIDLQQKLIEKDYASQGLNGFDYGSRYPGLTRVLQTAGRVIRSESDTGVVVLIDQRFNDQFYRDLFPAHWDLSNCANANQLAIGLQEFWRNNFELC